MPVLAKTKSEVISEFRCAEILDAARKVFSRKNFEQTTVDDIAAAAHVAKGTLYLYYKSKREIYMEALRRDIMALSEETDRRLQACDTAAEKIRAFIDTRVKFFEERRGFFRIYYSEFANFYVPLAPSSKGLRELYIRQAKRLEAILQQAVETGEIRHICARSTALRLYDMTLGVIAERLLGWSKATEEEDIEALFALLWKGIGKEHEI